MIKTEGKIDQALKKKRENQQKAKDDIIANASIAKRLENIEKLLGLKD